MTYNTIPSPPWPLGETGNNVCTTTNNTSVLVLNNRFNDQHRGIDRQPLPPSRRFGETDDRTARRGRGLGRSPTRSDPSFSPVSSHSLLLPRNRRKSCERRPDSFLPLQSARSPLRKAESGNGIRVIAVYTVEEFNRLQRAVG